MDAGAEGLDNSLREYLDAMRRDCDFAEADTEAGAAQGGVSRREQEAADARRQVYGRLDSQDDVGKGLAYLRGLDENAQKLKNMQSSLDELDRVIERKERKKEDVDRKIEAERQLEAERNGAKSRAAGR